MTLLEYWEKNRARNYTTEWFHRWICSTLERAYLERKNVILEAPPRHGKSELVNVYGPGWRLSEVFDENFMLVTNGDSLAKKFSSACRSLVKSPLEVDRDATWKIRGVESLNYSYHASGIRGQMTGHGASVLIFDDLLKSGQEGKSEAVRETVFENVVSAAMNRLSPDGIVVAMQARLHQQDPVGRLLEMEHLKFLRLHLPATNDGTEAWFHDGYSGERVDFPAYASLSARYGPEKLAEIKATSGPYYWCAQYAQVPALGSLAFFDVEKLPRYEHPNVDVCWVAVDCANTKTASGSFTALVGLGFDAATGLLKVLSVRRGRWRQDQIHMEIVDFFLEMGRLTGRNPESVIVERAAAGYGVIDGLGWRLPIVPLTPKGSKEDRAGAVCYLVNRGSVALPQAAPWLKAFRDELSNFPLTAHNDQVDAFVHALSYPARPSEFEIPEHGSEASYDAIEEVYQGGTLSEDLDEADGPCFGALSGLDF